MIALALDQHRLRQFLSLTKPRVVSLIVFTAVIGMFLAADAGGCEDACQHKLYATRQARTIQGREQERVVRVWLQATQAPALAPQLLAQHPGLVVARVDPAEWEGLPGDADPTRNIYLIDPLGNIVLRYPADPDIKGMAKDLGRLLRASRIG